MKFIGRHSDQSGAFDICECEHCGKRVDIPVPNNGIADAKCPDAECRFKNGGRLDN